MWHVPSTERTTCGVQATLRPTATPARLPPAPSGNQACLRAARQLLPVPLRPSSQPLARSLGNGAGGRVQTKLTVSQPGDAYEQEAERVAEEVMRTPSPLPAREGSDFVAPVVQRLCQECEEHLFKQEEDQPELAEEEFEDVADLEEETEEVEEVEEVEDDETGMPKRVDGASQPPAAEVEMVEIPRGPGRPLDAAARTFLEERMGYDFGAVRVHTDLAAAHSARRLQARAYTVGSDVYFNDNEYHPGTTAGRKLLAHELTHVVQQTAGRGPAAAARKPKAAKKPAKKKPQKQNVCSAGGCPQGKQKKVTRDDCATSEPADPKNFITQLNVSLSGQTVEVIWSNAPAETWPCSPNPSATPTKDDVVGVKCSINHTNKKRDGMAWFTGFDRQGLRIGFHNSQPVGKGFVSHGCVRVCCDKAKIINANTWSGKTTISVK